MNDDIRRFDRIQDYLNGNMPAEERQAFEAEMAADTNLADEVGVHRVEREMMDILLEDDLSGQLQAWQQEKQQMRSERPKRARWKAWAAGGIVLLGIILLVLYLMRPRPENTAPPSKEPSQRDQPAQEENMSPPSQQPEEPEKKRYDGPVAGSGQRPSAGGQGQDAGLIALAEELGGSPEFVGTSVRSGEEAKSRFDSATVLILDRRYDEAIALLQKIGDDDPEVFLNTQLHLGYLYFIKKNFRESIPHLEYAAANPDYLYAETADWYLLLACMAGGPGLRNKFEDRMAAILADKGHAYYSKALELQGRLK